MKYLLEFFKFFKNFFTSFSLSIKTFSSFCTIFFLPLAILIARFNFYFHFYFFIPMRSSLCSWLLRKCMKASFLAWFGFVHKLQSFPKCMLLHRLQFNILQMLKLLECKNNSYGELNSDLRLSDVRWGSRR